MGIAADLHGRAFGQARVGLPQLEAVPLGLPHQSLQGLQVQFRVGGMGDGLGLHRGVDADPLQTGGPHRAALQPGLDRGSQQRLQSVGSEPLAPARQRARIARQLMLEVLAATEPLFAVGLSSHDDAVTYPMSATEVATMARHSRPTQR